MGRSNAIVAAEPRPGNIPMMTPSTTPTKHNSKLSGCNETENPRARFETSSIQATPRAPRPDSRQDFLEWTAVYSRYANRLSLHLSNLYSEYTGAGECQLCAGRKR